MNQFVRCIGGVLLFWLLVPLNSAAASSSFKTLYAFPGGSFGAIPWSGLIADARGDLYGTTYEGGGTGCESIGCGTVFELKPNGTDKVIHVFTGGSDGALPAAGVITDNNGNLYGTTTSGGGGSCGGTYGCGTVFKLSPKGNETILYAFNGPTDGATPQAGVIRDAKGNLYGTAESGGRCSAFSNGCGTIFKLTPDGSFVVLYTFCQQQNCADGAFPTGALIRDDKGNLYGTASEGGDVNCPYAMVIGCGVVFELAPNGTETVLHAFTGHPDGNLPYAGLTEDKAGNFYGTTVWGGKPDCVGDYNCGAVFKITRAGIETVLYSFAGGTDGVNPFAGVIVTKNGDLYGTTYAGGNTGCNQDEGCGIVFKVAADGTETVLHNFDTYPGGESPFGGLIIDSAGNLYGTTQGGGGGGGHCNCGTVFKLRQ